MNIYRVLKSQWRNYLLFKEMLPNYELIKKFFNLSIYRLGIKNRVSFPLTINFLITNRCNLSCKFCSYKTFKGIEHNELTFNEISKFIEKIKFKNCAFFISGGEPFVRKDIMKIICKIKKEGFKLGICTNGTLLSENIIDSLIKFGVENLVFSLHGPEKIHNEITGDDKSYKLLIKNVKSLCEYKNRPKIIINCTISQDNIDYLENVADISEKLKVDALRFEHLSFLTTKEYKEQENIIYHKFNSNHFKINNYLLGNKSLNISRKVKSIMQKKFNIPVLFKPYLNIKDLDFWYSSEFNIKRKCFFIYHSIFIKPDGTVIPCEFLLYEMGNIKEDSLEDIINSQRFIRFRNLLRKELMPGCHRCCKL